MVLGRNLAPAIKLDRDDVPHRVSLPCSSSLPGSLHFPLLPFVRRPPLSSCLAIRRDSLGAKEIGGSEYE